MKIYFISGLGANKQAFKHIKIPTDFEPIFLEWKQPEKGEKFDHYVERMAEEINPNQAFHFAGLSFGGIVVQEMQNFLSPEKTILISTITNRGEMPGYMKLSSRLSAHKAVPMQFFTSESVLSYTFFRKLYDPKLPQLDEFFTHKDPYYLQWAINQIVNWKPSQKDLSNIFQMHGTNDLIFPHKYISDKADLVKGGSHVMVLQKPKEVTKLLNKYLLE